MKMKKLSPAGPVLAGLLLVATAGSWASASSGPAPGSAGAQEPGLPAGDPFPNACIDCHLNFAERDLDVRLSTILAAWREEVRPETLRKARAVAPRDLELVGRHPDVTESLGSIPAACATCHGPSSTEAPPLAALMHLLHLTGQENHYLAEFQGACTPCHKLDQSTGAWSVPSAREP